MRSTSAPQIPYKLIAGDALALLIVTWIGFGTHGESIANLRWLTTFLPLCIGWGLAAPWFGLYRADTAGRTTQVWRAALAMLLAGPLATWLRGALLDAPILPVFVLVLTGVSAVGMVLWRLIFAWISARQISRKIPNGGIFNG
jgi:hypothetical protein